LGRLTCRAEQRHFAEFIEEWGEGAMVQFLLRTQVNVKRSGGFYGISEQYWLRLALGMLKDAAGLEQVAAKADDKMVREAAAHVLAERQSGAEANAG
jgi:hypothetical protein